MTKIVALVPMRHHSQRVPGKNYRALAGKPVQRFLGVGLEPALPPDAALERQTRAPAQPQLTTANT